MTTNNSEQIEEFDPKTIFSKIDLMHYREINRYFRDVCTDENKKKMIAIINGDKNEISLRLLDWFVTKFIKQRNIKTLGKINIIDIDMNYSAQLSTYGKKNLDPFRRHTKFVYKMTIDDQPVDLLTTLGQLTFFHWVFEYECNLISLIESSKDFLIEKMNKSNKNEKQIKEANNKIITSVKNVTKQELQFTITFD